MNKLKLYIIAVSVLLQTIELQWIPNTKEEININIDTEETDAIDQINFETCNLSYEEIDTLLEDETWQKEKKYKHQLDSIIDKNTQEIVWDTVFEKIKKNNQQYLEEQKEKEFLTEFSDTELKEKLKQQKDFIEMMDNLYQIDLQNVACNLEDTELLKDKREPDILIPYYATYEPSTKTTILLEDPDKEYAQITDAHEETHFLQSRCKHISDTKIKQSVWEEPIEYSQKGIPSPLRTICLDEYIAYIQSQKINPEYLIDSPSFDLLLLLECAMIPNKNYQYQDTLSKLSLTQNQEEFYQLFQATTEEKQKKVHYLMHTIDLCYGYFREEAEQKQASSEELITSSLLEINRIFYRNLIHSVNDYDLDTLFHLINLEKEFSLYILENYLLENDIEDIETVKETFFNEYQKLESILLTELSALYQDPYIVEKFQNFTPTKIPITDCEKNQQLYDLIETYLEEYDSYQKQKSLYEIPLS